jgi:putative ABC transport system permease protein
MKFFYPIKMAINNLWAAKFRSFLTILGIIIGVASVVLIMAIGESAQRLILDQVQGMGTNLIGVLPGASDEEGPPAQAFGIKITSFKYDDYQAIMNKNNVPQIEAGAAYVQGSEAVVYKEKDEYKTIQGVTHQYPIIQNAELAEGRFFNQSEDTNLSRVAVLGSAIREDYFGQTDPIGKKIKIGKENFTVIGYFESKGGGGLGSSGQDDVVFVPLFTAQKLLFGIDYLAFARFKVRDVREIEISKELIKKTLRIQHNIDTNEEDDFSVRDLASAVQTITNITDILTYFLTLIAAVSLLVGGVGIMNIMLISVNERVREVGLRKALGARRYHIVSQFLIEAVTVTLTGGIFGIFAGIGISFLIAVAASAFGYEWEFLINKMSLFLAISVSIIIGLIFGVYPARKAGRISPMEALRYE